jgi:hypothetical protein
VTNSFKKNFNLEFEKNYTLLIFWNCFRMQEIDMVNKIILSVNNAPENFLKHERVQNVSNDFGQ